MSRRLLRYQPQPQHTPRFLVAYFIVGFVGGAIARALGWQ